MSNNKMDLDALRTIIKTDKCDGLEDWLSGLSSEQVKIVATAMEAVERKLPSPEVSL